MSPITLAAFADSLADPLMAAFTSVGWAALAWTLPLGALAVALRLVRRAPAAVVQGAFTVLLAGLVVLPFTRDLAPALLPAAAASIAAPAATVEGQPAAQAGRAASAPTTARAAAAQAPARSAALATPSAASPEVAAPWNPVSLLAFAWVTGLVLLLGRRLALGLALSRASRATTEAPAELDAACRRAAAQVGYRGSWRLRLAGDAESPYVYGLFRPTVVLPEGATRWPARQLDTALCHELLHLRRRDLGRLLLADLATAIFFFHPGAWWAAARLRRSTEKACDQAVVDAGHARNDYAADLLAIARAAAAPRLRAGLAMARPSSLEERLRALVAGEGRRWPRALQLPMAATLALMILLAGGLRPGEVAALEWLRHDPAGFHQLDCGKDAGEICVNGHRKARALLERTAEVGTVVVQDVATGEIALYAERGSGKAVPLTSPASVAKLALAAMWWDAGMPDTTKACGPSWTSRKGLHVRNWGDDQGSITVPAGMIVHSCNTAAAAMAENLLDKMGAAAIQKRFAELGFGSYAESDERRPDESFWSGGQLDAPPKPVVYDEGRFEELWPRIAAGAGPTATTPLHVASFMQAIGNGGVALPPYLGGHAAKGSPRTLMQRSTAEKLRRALNQVVHEGTAKDIEPQLEFATWQLEGKTGSRLQEGRKSGWFAGLATDAGGKPRYVVVVYLDGISKTKAAGIAVEMTRFLARQAGDEL